MDLDLSLADTEITKRKRPRKARDLGRLHALLIRGLPDWVDEDGLLLSYDIAKELGISYQAIYRIYKNERIPPKRIAALIELSAQSRKRGDDFAPLTHEDFAEFLG